MYYDLHEEVAELFDHAEVNWYVRFSPPGVYEMDEDHHSRLLPGMHYDRSLRTRKRGPRAATAVQRKANSAATLARRDVKIRAAILAGERPKPGGRPATRWMRIAKELGVVL